MSRSSSRSLNRRRFLSNCLTISTGALLAPPLLNRAMASTLRPFSTSSSYAFIGDGGYSPDEDGALRSSLLKSNVKNLILGGDNRYDTMATLEETWDDWRADGFDFRMVTIGNHTPGYAEEVRYFKMPAEYYAKRENGALFLVLNSDNDETGTEQGAWLRTQLQQANDRFIFVIHHHPSFNVSDYHEWEERENFQNAVRPVIRDFAGKITAILNGHEHQAGVYDANGIPLIVAGACVDTRGHAYETSAELDGIKYTTNWIYKGQPCWLRLDLDATAGTALASFVDIKTQAVTYTKDLARRENLR